jgi:hypothetical protein
VNSNHHTEKLKLRESLTAEIVSDVEQEIDDVLMWAPDNLTADDRKAIRDEVIAQTRHVTDALTTVELQNEGARREARGGVVDAARKYSISADFRRLTCSVNTHEATRGMGGPDTNSLESRGREVYISRG